MIMVNLKKLSVVALLCLSLNAFSTNYYISNTGNNNNAGTSEGSAWATIDKLNSSTLASGDIVYFERGSVFFGSILLKISGVTYTAYGTGPLPVISGYQTLSGWENQGGNVWRTVSPSTDVRILVINDESQPLGRYPNDEWLEYETGNGRTGLIDNQLSHPAGHWNNGQCVVYSSNWTLDAVRIAAHTGTELIFGEQLAYSITSPLSTEKEYFIQNHPNTLDLVGEWANWGGYVYLYSEVDPNSLKVQVTTLGNAFTSSASVLNNVTIENLKIFGFNGSGVRLNYYNNGPCENPVIQNCDFEDIGDMAVNASGVTNLNVLNNTFTDILNNGIYMYYCNTTLTEGNKMTNIGMEYGRGGNGNGTYTGIEYINGTNHTVTKNHVVDVGYRCISMAHSDNPVITENVVDGACNIKTDGGAIYAWNRTLGQYTGGEISRNIVKNVVGSVRVLEGVSHHHSDVYAIYIDDDNKTLTIADNVIMNSSTAIFIHNSQDIDMLRNTIYNCVRGIYFRAGGGGGDSSLIGDCDVIGNKILHTADNIETTRDENTLYLRWNRDASPSYPIPSYNIFEDNYYLTPFTDDNHIRVTDSYVADSYNLTTWQQNNAGLNGSNLYHDQNSLEEPIKYDAGSGIAASNFVFFDYADFEAKTIELIDQYVDIDGNVVTGSVTLAPFKSIILFKTNEVYDISGSIPTDLSADEITESKVDLSWRPAVGSTGVVGFEIYRDGNLVGTSTTTNYSDNTVESSTTYSYQVLAYDAANSKSGLSTVLSVTTLASTEPEPLPVPFNLASTTVTINQVAISWSVSSTSNIAGYEIHRDGVLVGTSTTTSYTDNTVAASTGYSYKVLAFNAENAKGGFSTALAIVTPDEEQTEPGENYSPVINIDYDIIAYSGTERQLDASATYDPDGDNLTYRWNVPSDVSVLSTVGQSLTFLAPDVVESEVRDFELIVSDGKVTETKVVNVVVAPYKPTIEEIGVRSIETSSYDGDNYPENVIDGNQGTYWSANGDEQWICLELNTPVNPSHLKVAYFNGENRKASFELFASNDNENFVKVEGVIESCGYSSKPHVHDFPNIKSTATYKYIKLVGHGSDKDENNTLSEIKVYGLKSGTSSNKELLEDNVNVYPNPAISNFIVELERESQVRLMDMGGKVVLEETMPAGTNDVMVTFPSGNYILQVIADNKSLARSIIIR